MMDYLTVSERVRCHLNDTGSLVWTDDMLETAVRSALQAVSRVYGEVHTLAGLDEAEETTLPEGDEHVLVTGGVAYALTFRASGRFEDAVPTREVPEALANWATAHMARFQTMLAEVKVGAHQESDQVPYSEWEWDEDQ
jgi:hypothetical protein